MYVHVSVAYFNTPFHICAGFEKMNSGLSENFPDRVSPIQQHVAGLQKLGVEPGPLNPHVNAVTSDVVKVR